MLKFTQSVSLCALQAFSMCMYLVMEIESKEVNMHFMCPVSLFRLS